MNSIGGPEGGIGATPKAVIDTLPAGGGVNVLKTTTEFKVPTGSEVPAGPSLPLSEADKYKADTLKAANDTTLATQDEGVAAIAKFANSNTDAANGSSDTMAGFRAQVAESGRNSSVNTGENATVSSPPPGEIDSSVQTAQASTGQSGEKIPVIEVKTDEQIKAEVDAKYPPDNRADPMGNRSVANKAERDAYMAELKKQQADAKWQRFTAGGKLNMSTDNSTPGTGEVTNAVNGTPPPDAYTLTPEQQAQYGITNPRVDGVEPAPTPATEAPATSTQPQTEQSHLDKLTAAANEAEARRKALGETYRPPNDPDRVYRPEPQSSSTSEKPPTAAAGLAPEATPPVTSSNAAPEGSGGSTGTAGTAASEASGGPTGPAPAEESTATAASTGSDGDAEAGSATGTAGSSSDEAESDGSAGPEGDPSATDGSEGSASAGSNNADGNAGSDSGTSASGGTEGGASGKTTEDYIREYDTGIAVASEDLKVLWEVLNGKLTDEQIASNPDLGELVYTYKGNLDKYLKDREDSWMRGYGDGGRPDKAKRRMMEEVQHLRDSATDFVGKDEANRLLSEAKAKKAAATTASTEATPTPPSTEAAPSSPTSSTTTESSPATPPAAATEASPTAPEAGSGDASEDDQSSTSHLSPEQQARRDEIKEKIANGTATTDELKEYRSFMQKPDQRIQELQQKLDDGTITDSEIEEFSRLKKGETPQQTPEQQLEALNNELSEMGMKIWDKMLKGEDASAEWAEISKKINEARGVNQSLAEQKQAQEFIKGILNADTKLSDRESMKRRAIREKLQELAKMEMELAQMRETISELKTREEEQKTDLKNAEADMNKPGLTPEERFAKTNEWSIKAIQVATTQESIRRTKNLGRITNAKRFAVKNYIHRKLGLNNPISNFIEMTVSAGHTAIVETTSDLDF